ncbi:prepilin peptidase [Anaerococcus tetradius]|uniref:Bacterial peptidase A24 protein n=1 Tax=Anaerococcus tetradius TaxID=33036 RepID=A0A133KEH4_9FIRM|nr:A24 family peptidase [Anaerococcus tetradius]KWZ77971.1 bacterial peptidase A24 protein [Anaerococcus tetradius]
MINLLIFFLGSIFGSFANLVVNRSISGESIVFPRSHCDFCKRKLEWFELIPIFSYIFLRGSCRSCGKKIGPSYLLMEVGGGFLALIGLLPDFNLKAFFIFASLILSMIIAIIDLKTMEIFQGQLISLIGLGLFYRLIFIGFSGAYFLELFGFSIMYLAIFYLSKKNIGDGDYYFYLGLSLFIKDSSFLLFILISIWLGGLVGLIILLKERKRGMRMPFAIFIYCSYLLILILEKGAFL